MKTHLYLIVTLASLIMLSPTATARSLNEAWTQSEINAANTAAGATYMTQLERDVILCINLARMYPQKFARLEVEGYPGPKGFRMDADFVPFRQELLGELYSRKPIAPLQPSTKMYNVALCWAKESGEAGIVGHTRISCSEDYYGECCQYAIRDALEIALDLLVDPGVESRGHRHICLDPEYTDIGVSHQPHAKWKCTTVLDFE